MLDAFFQNLRKIQKKEINESGLARVGSDFYPKVHSYINMLMEVLENNPFAEEEHRLLQHTRMIATDICSRREHKIADTAVNNIQRSYHLFTGKKPQFDSQDTTPLNLTPEEEQLYFSLMDIVRGHRNRLLPSLDVLNEENIPIKKSTPKPDVNQTYLFQTEEKKPVVDIFDEEHTTKTTIVNKNPKSPLVNGGELDSPKVEDDSKLANGALEAKPEKRNEFKKEVSQTSSVNYERENLGNIYDSIYGEEEFVDLPPDEPIKPFEINKTPTKEFNPDNISFKTLVVFDEVPEIIGIDEKVYGPFYPQDVVKMPELNADLFRKRRKGRFVKI